MKFKNKKAFSLLEVMLATVIFVFLLGICAEILIWASSVSHKVTAKGSSQNEAAKSIAWLISDLRQTSAESIYTDKGPSNTMKSLSFLSGIDESINVEYTMIMPAPKWKNFVLYYLRVDPKNSEKKLLLRKTFYDPLSYPYAFKKFIPEPMKPVDINSLCDGNLNITNRNRIVARNIYNLEILELDLNKNSCTLKVRTSEKSKKGLEEKAEFTTTIIMRNTIKQPI